MTKRNGAMETKNENNRLTEYQVGNTVYQVTPVFAENTKAEDIKDKILRLILQDRERENIKP
jgi:hypothetical protein